MNVVEAFFCLLFSTSRFLNLCGMRLECRALWTLHPILAMLPQLDLRHLYAVIVLSEELNFTRAARRLQISQPALSRKILDIENQHGFQLFVRDRKKPAQLTEAGRAFVQEARSALLHADRAILLARAAHYGYTDVLLVEHAFIAEQG